MPFKLHKKFLKSSHHLLDLKLCTVRLNDNSKFPWIMLIPKRKNINDITDLNSVSYTHLTLPTTPYV